MIFNGKYGCCEDRRCLGFKIHDADDTDNGGSLGENEGPVSKDDESSSENDELTGEDNDDEDLLNSSGIPIPTSTRPLAADSVTPLSFSFPQPTILSDVIETALSRLSAEFPAGNSLPTGVINSDLGRDIDITLPSLNIQLPTATPGPPPPLPGIRNQIGGGSGVHKVAQGVGWKEGIVVGYVLLGERFM